MPTQDIVVTPTNSPYVVPSPSATYGHVTIQPGGLLVFPQPTTMTCDTLEKSVALAR
ncbi:MAG TPA: hypothetical protein VHS58_23750 [Acetobacteraceae bacterium]|jgi:hypothetical protein|nr:hypothetical protein [Acetobacteraceae bacterium]